MSELDLSLYTRTPILTLPSGITLARALVVACPRALQPLLKKPLAKLSATADDAQAALAARQRELGVITEEDARKVDHEADASWTALQMRLEAWTLLPVERYPESERARRLIDALFGAGGLSFLRSQYHVQVTSMDALLRRIDEEQLADDLTKLAGPEFLAQLHDVQPRYERMVEARQRRDEAITGDLREHVRALGRAIVDYAIKVTATYDEDTPETLPQIRGALRAIEVHRELTARRGAAPPDADTTPKDQ